jgi:beta-lactamase class A
MCKKNRFLPPSVHRREITLEYLSNGLSKNTNSSGRVMFRRTKRPLVCFFLALPLLSVRPLVASDAYDVSYVWSRNAAGVLEYREQVGRVLGPDVAGNLEVVARDKLYGLNYRRHGDSEGAARVARAHTRLLRSRGLEPAAPIRARDWKRVDAVGATEESDGVSASVPKFASENGDEAGTETFKREGAVELASLAPVNVPELGSVDKRAERDRKLRHLEAAVEDYIDGLRREGKIEADERTGWSVYDFTTGQKLVTINEDMEFQSASLVKPFIAAAFFYKVEQGELIYGPTSRRHMRRMIQHSNNASTNWVTRKVGGPRAVERLLKRQYPAIFQNTHVVEYIPANGRTYRNKASIHDYSRFLYAIWKGNIAGAKEIKRLMALPGSDRIFTGAREVPRGTRVYNKTGSTARLCGDMGILSVKGKDGKRYPYTLIGVIEKEHSADNYTTWIRSRSDVIRNVSNIVYRGIAEHHDI